MILHHTMKKLLQLMRAIAVAYGGDLCGENLLHCEVVAAVDDDAYSCCSVVDGSDFSLSPCCENLPCEAVPAVDEGIAAVDDGMYSSCSVVDGSDLSP